MATDAKSALVAADAGLLSFFEGQEQIFQDKVSGQSAWIVLAIPM